MTRFEQLRAENKQRSTREIEAQVENEELLKEAREAETLLDLKFVVIQMLERDHA